MTWLRLYPLALGEAWESLPGPLRALHDPSPALDAEGRFTVTRARSPLARLVLALAGMPPAGIDLALRLVIRAQRDHQVWDRDFGGFGMRTVQTLLPDGRMSERRGAMELLFHVAAEPAAIVYRPAGARLCLGPLRIPIPSWCGPRVEARAWCAPGASVMHVSVSISAPLLGPLVTYGGALAPIE